VTCDFHAPGLFSVVLFSVSVLLLGSVLNCWKSYNVLSYLFMWYRVSQSVSNYQWWM